VRGFLFTVVVLAAIALPTRLRADGPDFSAFSRSWYIQVAHLVVAEDGSAVVLSAQLGNPSQGGWETIQFNSVSDDGLTAYGVTIGSGALTSAAYLTSTEQTTGEVVALTLVSPHSAWLSSQGNARLFCDADAFTEDPVPNCGNQWAP
jgi:hypothetical protein